MVGCSCVYRAGMRRVRHGWVCYVGRSVGRLAYVISDAGLILEADKHRPQPVIQSRCERRRLLQTVTVAHCSVASWQGKGRGGEQLPLQILVCRNKFYQRYKIWGSKSPTLRDFGATVCWKIPRDTVWYIVSAIFGSSKINVRDLVFDDDERSTMMIMAYGP